MDHFVQCGCLLKKKNLSTNRLRVQAGKEPPDILSQQENAIGRDIEKNVTGILKIHSLKIEKRIFKKWKKEIRLSWNTTNIRIDAAGNLDGATKYQLAWNHG